MSDEQTAAERRPPGRPRSDNPLTEQITVYMTPGMRDELEAVAYEASSPGDQVSLTEIIRRACDGLLKSRGKR